MIFVTNFLLRNFETFIVQVRIKNNIIALNTSDARNVEQILKALDLLHLKLGQIQLNTNLCSRKVYACHVFSYIMFLFLTVAKFTN